MTKLIMFAIWVLTMIAVGTIASTMISSPNTIQVLIGIAMLFIAFIVSVKTMGFTKNPFKRK